MRIIEVNDVGWDAAVVEIEGEDVLFLNTALSTEDRIAVLTDALAGQLS